MNYLRIKLLLICAIGCLQNSNAQIIHKIELRLINEARTPIDQAVVQIRTSTISNPILIGITDEKGILLFDPVDNDSLVFSISHISYGNVQKIIYRHEWVLNKITIQLAEASLTLPEISVKGRDHGIRIIGDTIRFDLRILASGKEKDLNQLLKRLPGMEISSTGNIRYNGRAVNKILLGGKDIIRSQFELANSLILPKSLSTIEIINDTKAKVSGNVPQYLNLVLKKDQSYISSNSIKYAAPNNRGEADASILSTGSRDLGYYALFRFSSTNKPAITSADLIRSNDFDMESLISRNETGNHGSTFENLNLNDFSSNKKKDFVFQLNSQLKKKKTELTLFGQYRNLNIKGFQSTSRQEIITNTIIESTEKNQTSSTQYLNVNIKGVFDISKKISSIVYVQTESDRIKSSSTGTTVYDGQSTPFETTIKPRSLSFSALHQIKYEIDSAWSFNFYTRYNREKNYNDYNLLDSYQIYDIGMLKNGLYNLAGNIERRPERLNTSANLIRVAGPIELGLGYQNRFSSFTEKGQLQESGSDTDFTKTNSFNEAQHLYYSQLVYKFSSLKLKAKVGISQNTYTSQKRNSERLAPYFRLRLSGMINRLLNFSLGFNVQTNIIDLDKLWANAVPVGNRNYILNRHQLLYSKSYGISASARYINAASATNFLFRINYLFSDKSIVLNQQNLGGYQIQFGTASPGVQSINALSYFSKKIGKHRISYIQNISWSNQNLVNNNNVNTVNRLHGSVQLRLSSEWAKWLSTTLVAKANYTRQTINSFSTSFTSVQPRLSLFFPISNKVNFEISSSFDQIDDIKIKPNLSGELSIKSGNEKFRYIIGVFNALNFSAYTYRYATIESSEVLFRNVTRMPGAVKIGVVYRPFD